MIRLILIAITVIFDVVVSIPIQLLTWLFSFTPIGKYTDRIAFKIAQLAIGFLGFESGARVEVTGIENIPKDRAVLYAGNHNSYFDIILTICRLPGLTGYISKKDLKKVPLVNVWMIITHCLFLDRDDMKSGVKMIQDAVANINNGISMFIFPEGTRNKTGDERNMAQMKDASFKIAEKSLCPVIPVAITGTANLFEAHKPYVRSADVTIDFGEPVYPDQLDVKERKHMGSLVQGKILEMLEKRKS